MHNHPNNDHDQADSSDLSPILEYLVDSSSEMIFWTDEQGKFLGVNDLTCDRLGYTREEFKTMRVRDIDPEINDKSHADFLRLLDETSSVTVQTQPQCKDGTFITMEFTVAKLEIANRIYLCTHGREIVLEKQLRDRVFDAIAKNLPLNEGLSLITQLAEKTRTELQAVIMVLDDKGRLCPRGGSSLHAEFISKLSTLQPGPQSLSCGTATFNQQSVLVNDISQSPLWESFHAEAKSADVHACWSEPIFSSKNEILGTFAMYFQSPQMPNNYDRELMQTFANLAGIAIERSQRTETLEENERQLRLITDSLPVIIMYVDRDYRLQFSNAMCESRMMISKESNGQCIEDLIGKTTFDSFAPYFDLTFSGQTAQFEHRSTTEDGSTIYDIRMLPDVGPNQRVVGTYLLIDDITKRRVLEREVLNSSTKTQMQIGQDLHDGVGQELTGLGMIADTLFLSLTRDESKESPLAEKLAKGVKRSLQQIRLLSRGLNPVDISTDGLESALVEMADHVEDLYGIQCQVNCGWKNQQPDNQIATQLFRIAQEATTNAAKHGLARFVKISVGEIGNVFELSVIDDGIGFVPSHPDHTGMGIRSMNYRAGLVGGRLNIMPHPSGGTEVKCQISVRQINDSGSTSEPP